MQVVHSTSFEGVVNFLCKLTVIHKKYIVFLLRALQDDFNRGFHYVCELSSQVCVCVSPHVFFQMTP